MGTGTGTSLYVNGALLQTCGHRGSTCPCTGSARCSTAPGTPPRHLDDLIVRNTAMTAQQVKTLYDGYGAEAGLVVGPGVQGGDRHRGWDRHVHSDAGVRGRRMR